MLLRYQHHRHGGVVMEQVEEVEPVQFHQLYGCAGYGVIAVAAFAPGDVLVAEHFAGSVAKPVARVID